MWRFVRYEPDGSTKWAIWSSVVEDWIYYDMTEDELVEFYVEQEAKQVREDARERIEEAKSGDRVDHETIPPRGAIDRLKRTHQERRRR